MGIETLRSTESHLSTSETMTARTILILFISTAAVSAGVMSDGQEVENGDQLLGNKISLSQVINPGGGCCEGIDQVLACIKDIKKDIASILKANSTTVDGDDTGNTEEPTTTKARTITEGPTTTDELTTTKEPTTTEIPTTTKVQCSGEWKYFDGSCYLRSSDKLAWKDAINSCKSKGGSLLSIHSSQENSFVQSINSGYPWMGLTNATGILEWFDGTPVDYQGTWFKIYEEKLECSLMLPSGEWDMMESYCQSPRFYFCKKKAGEA